VLSSSDGGKRPEHQFIDLRELTARCAVPETWIRERVRTRCENPLPHVRFGKYVRFRWRRPWLRGWASRAAKTGKEQQISKQVSNDYSSK
jgi:hypothetical protein